VTDFWALLGAMAVFVVPILLAWWWIGPDSPPVKRKRAGAAKNEKMRR
jgi:hypothetical protein